MHWPKPALPDSRTPEPYDPFPGLLRVMIITTVVAAGIQAVCQRGCSSETPVRTAPVPVQPIPPHISPEPKAAPGHFLASNSHM